MSYSSLDNTGCYFMNPDGLWIKVERPKATEPTRICTMSTASVNDTDVSVKPCKLVPSDFKPLINNTSCGFDDQLMYIDNGTLNFYDVNTKENKQLEIHDIIKLSCACNNANSFNGYKKSKLYVALNTNGCLFTIKTDGTFRKFGSIKTFKVHKNSVVVLTEKNCVFMLKLNYKEELVCSHKHPKLQKLIDTVGDNINITDVFCHKMYFGFIEKNTQTIYTSMTNITIPNEFVDYDKVLYFCSAKGNLTQFLLVLYDNKGNLCYVSSANNKNVFQHITDFTVAV